MIGFEQLQAAYMKHQITRQFLYPTMALKRFQFLLLAPSSTITDLDTVIFTTIQRERK